MAIDRTRQGERTPLLPASDPSAPSNYLPSNQSALRTRRRSSAFLSFLSETYDTDDDAFGDRKRDRTITLLVVLSSLYYTGIMFVNSFSIEEIQTLSCAEYYYPSTTYNVNLPLDDDPTRLCSVPFVDKRTSEVSAYTDTLASFSGCISSLIIAKFVLPRCSRRAAALLSVATTTIFFAALSLVPTHYSLDPRFPSTSSIHPTTAQHIFVGLFLVAGFFGSPQIMFPVVMQVIAVDVCKEEEKAATFAKLLAGNLIGATLASFWLLVAFPFFGVHFSILHHTGPCSPLLVAAGMMAITFVLVALLLPETKPSLISRKDTDSIPETASLPQSSTHLDESRQGAYQNQIFDNSTADSTLSAGVSWLRPVVDTLSLSGYILPYRPSPDVQWDYKLSVMLSALLFADTLTLAWSNVVVFATSHLEFGPEDVAVFLGVLGASKSLYSLFVLPIAVKQIRKLIKKRIRNDIIAGETPVFNRRENYVVETDKIVAMMSLGFDVFGWICIGLAAKQLSVAGIYAGLGVLLFSTGAIVSIQALAVDLFQAQNRPSSDPIADRDAFITLFALFQNITATFGPVANNLIYNWSIDNHMNFLVFLCTAGASTVSMLLVASVGFLVK